MSLSFYLIALLPVLTAPLLTYRIAQGAYEWQRRQIAIDNAAILLGTADREIARALQSGNAAQQAIEVAHHEAHACAHSPAANPGCLAADEALELKISLSHREMQLRASSSWGVNGLRAAAYLSSHRVTNRIDRAASVPIDSVTCPICGLEVYWEKKDAFRTVFLSDGQPKLGANVTVDGSTLVFGGEWNYQLDRPRDPEVR